MEKIVFRKAPSKLLLRRSYPKLCPFHNLTMATWLCTRARCAPSLKKLNPGRRVENQSSTVPAPRSPHSISSKRIFLCASVAGSRALGKNSFLGGTKKSLLRASYSKLSPLHKLATAMWLCAGARCAPCWKKLNFERCIENQRSFVAAPRPPHSMISQRPFSCADVAGPLDLGKNFFARLLENCCCAAPTPSCVHSII